MAVCALALVGATRAGGGASGSGNVNTALNGLLTPYLARYGLPAVGAAVVKDGHVVAAGAVGTRRAGERMAVSATDRFHLGSDTKAMTSLLAAILVEEGRIRWTSTPGDVFPELAETMDPGLRGVTLEQLLSHTSGIPGDNQVFGDLLDKVAVQDGNLDELRAFMVRQWARQPLAAKPGTTFAYSNMGYTLAGAMLERVAGKTYEELVTERVWTPLGLRSAGFGPQASVGRVDAPLGHLVVDGKLKPVLAGPNGDNPAVIGPAGTAHMSLLDFARWAGWNAGEGKRGPRLVKPETLKKLHTPVITLPAPAEPRPGTPPGGAYALGWGQVSYPWSAEPVIYHGGSNQRNLAHIVLQPKQDLAMVLVTNVAGERAAQALDVLAAELYGKYAAPSPSP